MDSTTIN